MEITIGGTNVGISEANFEAFRSDLLDAYMTTLREDGITTISEYFSRLPEPDGGDGVEIASKLEDNELGLHVFFRCLPFNDPSLMFIMDNPKLDRNPSDFEKPETSGNRVEVYDLHEKYPDTSAMAAATANYLSTTLYPSGSKEGWSKFSETVIYPICSATSGIDIGEKGLESYFQADLARDYEKGGGNGVIPTKGFFKDFYYTNLHKTPTVASPHVFDCIESLAEETIHLEIELADPDVVFVGGGKAWSSVWDAEELTPLSDEFTSANTIGNVHGQLFKSSERYFVPVYHPSARKNQYTYDENVRMLNRTLKKLADDSVL